MSSSIFRRSKCPKVEKTCTVILGDLRKTKRETLSLCGLRRAQGGGGMFYFTSQQHGPMPISDEVAKGEK